MSDTLGRPTSQIQDLAARWEGAASEEFQTRWHDWQAGASQVMEAMGVFLGLRAAASR